METSTKSFGAMQSPSRFPICCPPNSNSEARSSTQNTRDSFESLGPGVDGLTRVQASLPRLTQLGLSPSVLSCISTQEIPDFTNHPLSKYKDVCTPTHDLQQRFDRPDIRSYSRTSNHERERWLTHAAQETSLCAQDQRLSPVFQAPYSLRSHRAPLSKVQVKGIKMYWPGKSHDDTPCINHINAIPPAKTLNDDIQNLVTPTENVGSHELAVSQPATIQVEISNSFNEALMTMEDWPIPGLDFLQELGDVDTSGDDPSEVNTNHWMSLADRNILYYPIQDELPRWKSEMLLHCFQQPASPPAAWLPRTNFQIPDPNQLYRQVISGLQQQPDLESCDADRKHSILLTILVLLVGVMVTGRSDFPMLFRMLESALAAIGGGEALGDGEVANFILPQVSKFRLYAAPLLSEESGLEVVSSQDHAARLFYCLNNQLSEYPEHSASFAFITDLVQQAINMYLEQVVRNSALSASNMPTALEIADSITRVEHFKETLEAFPPGAPGEQVIIWASFVAAASCLLDEHMQFFEDVFMRHYLRSGFANLITGLEVLRKIWARKPDERWTLLLAGIKILVM
ncbi:hypothetical protein NM208_g3384 [Fusarium decemcellulare]|uniref:Uncharacterized protein n=1 Tax=Fusarium decemcellulare TaxID=57161 RepID=A0ACC1SPF5_9HYPO|nr:hypothetical protein NM208_g3384 [Fusarium decemcellulare]